MATPNKFGYKNNYTWDYNNQFWKLSRKTFPERRQRGNEHHPPIEGGSAICRGRRPSRKEGWAARGKLFQPHRPSIASYQNTIHLARPPSPPSHHHHDSAETTKAENISRRLKLSSFFRLLFFFYSGFFFPVALSAGDHPGARIMYRLYKCKSQQIRWQSINVTSSCSMYRM